MGLSDHGWRDYLLHDGALYAMTPQGDVYRISLYYDGTPYVECMAYNVKSWSEVREIPPPRKPEMPL